MKNRKLVIPKNTPLDLRPSRHEIIGQGPADLGPSPDPTRDLIPSVFISGVKLDDFAIGCLPECVQLLTKSLRGCSDLSMVGPGERHTVPLVEACLLKKPLGPTKGARVIGKLRRRS